jgi:hypothetical protein
MNNNTTIKDRNTINHLKRAVIATYPKSSNSFLANFYPGIMFTTQHIPKSDGTHIDVRQRLVQALKN